MTRSHPFRFLGLVVLGALGAQVLVSAQSVLSAPPPIIQLTMDPATDVRPAWSPDGRLVAFQSTRAGTGNFHIWVMDADGKSQRALTRGDSDDRHPYWSPDGKQIAFASASGGAREIWTMNRDGSNRRQITKLGQDTTFPAWSPDGKTITFYSYKDGALSLWVVGADGSKPRPLVPSLALQRQNQCTFACHQALWSPDGKKVSYSGGDHRSVWVINADGSDPVQLTKRNEADHQHFPWWLKDGRLGYIVENVTPAASWTDVWALRLPGGMSELLLGKLNHQGPLQWSPNESKVLFHSPRAGNFDIYAVDLKASGGPEALQEMLQGSAVVGTTPASSPPAVGASPLGVAVVGLAVGAGAILVSAMIVARLRGQKRTRSR